MNADSPIVGTGDTVGAGVRRTALLLHAAEQGDRQWMLSRLEPAQRAELEVLLAELSTMGVPADRDLLRHAVDDPASAGRPRVAERPARGPEDELAAMTAGRVGRVLASEPDALVVGLLRQREWPWQDALLAQLDSAKRRRIEEALQMADSTAPRPATRLERALVHGVLQRAQRLEVLPEGDREAAPASRWTAAMRRMVVALPWARAETWRRP